MGKVQGAKHRVFFGEAKRWLDEIGVTDTTELWVHGKHEYTAYFADHASAVKAREKIQRAGGVKVIEYKYDRHPFKTVRFHLLDEAKHLSVHYRHEMDTDTRTPRYFVYRLGECVAKADSEEDAIVEMEHLHKEIIHANKLVRRNAILREIRTLEAMIAALQGEMKTI